MADSISKSYAQALMDLFDENNIKYEIGINDLKDINTIISDKDCMSFLLHPGIPKVDKEELLNKSFKDNNNTIRSFILVLLENKRIDLLSDIISALEDRIDEINNILRVEVISSNTISDEYYNKIIKVLENNYQKKIIGKVTIDKDIIGGIKVLINGKVIDDTLLNRLNSIRNSIINGAN